MPQHQQATTCSKGGGPVSKYCSCAHCTLSICAVCGAYEGGLTTDCPGTEISFDRQRAVYETSLDYTDARGWHQGASMEHRIPRFTSTPIRPEPVHVDPRTIAAPTIDWPTVDRCATLQHELTLRAVAWALADRDCDDLSAALIRAEAESVIPQRVTEPDACRQTLLSSLKSDFQRACRLVEERDEALRQIARQFVDILEAPNSRAKDQSDES